jgi:hypothetical protein
VLTIALIAVVACTATFAPATTSVKIKPLVITFNKNAKNVSSIKCAFGAILVVLTELSLNLAYRTFIRTVRHVKD